MSLYSIGSALMTGIGRLEGGSNQAITSRYSTMTVPFWVALVFFLLLLIKYQRGDSDPQAAQKKFHREQILKNNKIIAGWSFMAVITILILGSISELMARDFCLRSKRKDRPVC